MPREWGATGAFDHFPPRLSHENREYIYELLKGCGVADVDCQSFLGELAEAVGRYDAHANERERTKPAVVRANLDRAVEVATTLLTALNNLDGNSRALLREVEAVGVATAQDHVAQALYALSKAKQAANEYPKSGNLVQHHRLLLAVDVADAMRRHLNIEPTLTREGIFEGILEIVLKEATRSEVKATHALARRALREVVKWKVEDGPSGYEFVK